MSNKAWACVVVLLVLYIAYMNWPRGAAIVPDQTIAIPQQNKQIETLQTKAKGQTVIIIKPSENIESAIKEWSQ